MKNGVLSIRIENLTVKYQETLVLDHFNLTLPPRGCVCFFGLSGSGKTTLLRTIAGLKNPSSGEILVEWTKLDGNLTGNPTANPPGNTQRYGDRMENGMPRMAYVFQENRLIPWLTALENVALVLLNKDLVNKGEAYGIVEKMEVHGDDKKGKANETAKKWLTKVGLEDALEKYPSQLSGGMRQRVNIARALAFDAPVILLDEPFKELDDTIKSQIISIFLELKKDRLILLVTHDKEDARLLADRTVPISG